MSDYYYGQGKFFAGIRLGKAVPILRWLMDVSELKSLLSVETKEHKESYTGQRANAKKLVVGKSLSLTYTCMEHSKENLALALYGTATTIPQGTVTGEVLPSGIAAGDRVPLKYLSATEVVITDSAATPATLDSSKYDVDSVYGAITFKDVTGVTQPLKVAYKHGDIESVSMFTTPQPELFLRYEGINLAENGAPVVAEFYKVSTEPLKELALISTDISGMQITGEALIDPTRPYDPELGQFGRILRPKAA